MKFKSIAISILTLINALVHDAFVPAQPRGELRQTFATFRNVFGCDQGLWRIVRFPVATTDFYRTNYYKEILHPF